MEVRDWVEKVAIPNEDRVAELNEVPQDLVDDMQARGYFAWAIPEEYGGLGLTTEELVLGCLSGARWLQHRYRQRIPNRRRH